MAMQESNNGSSLLFGCCLLPSTIFFASPLFLKFQKRPALFWFMGRNIVK
jgi:hypothetical protein